MQTSPRFSFVKALYAINIALCLTTCHSFGIVGPVDVHTPFVNDAITTASSFLEHYNSQTIATATVAADFNLLSQYKQLLATNPLPTKMVTGGALAVVGDAIAQSRDEDKEYDVPRAVSFMSFDMCYRTTMPWTIPRWSNKCLGAFHCSPVSLTSVIFSSYGANFGIAVRNHSLFILSCILLTHWIDSRSNN